MTMPNARELAIFEKWSEAAVSSIPPLSPTSPKATKFCCCPNRRRYNIKRSKKTTLHPKNLFLDNDFRYIDEFAIEKPNKPNLLSLNTNVIGTKETTLHPEDPQTIERCCGDDTKVTIRPQRKCKEKKDKHNIETNWGKSEYSFDCGSCLSSAKLFETNEQTPESVNLPQLVDYRNCPRRNSSKHDNDQLTRFYYETSSKAPQTEDLCYAESENCRCKSNDKQQIQRLSNSRPNISSSCTCNCKVTSDCPELTRKEYCANEINDCRHQEQLVLSPLNKKEVGNDANIGLKPSVADISKLQEIPYGSNVVIPANVTSDSLAMATTGNASDKLVMQSPAQPSITTTVIKTTMVKRSPSNEKDPIEGFKARSYSPAESEPALSVKQRIANISAGSDPNHIGDRSSKVASQCNKNGYEHKVKLQRSPPVSSTASKTLPFPVCKRDLSSKTNNPVKENNFRRSPGSKQSAENSLVTATGCATIPRRSSFKTITNGISDNNTQTGDVNQKFTALDNLDLALNLADENGEDPYFVLQEYLEKVKHEINEVFELHKAKQKVQSTNSASYHSKSDLSQSMEALNTGCDNIDKSNKSKTKLADKFMANVLNKNPTQEQIAQVTENHEKCKSVGPKLASTPRPNREISKLEKNQQLQPQEKGVQSEEVNIWANKFLKDLDTLIATDRHDTLDSALSSTNTTTSAGQNRLSKAILERTDESHSANGFLPKPEKHTTIPLQSFNLEGGRIGNSNCKETKTNIAYMRTLSAPMPCEEQQNDNELSCVAASTSNRNSFAAFNTSAFDQYRQQHPVEVRNNRLENSHNTGAAVTSAPKATLILKIEETATCEAKSGDPPTRNTVDARKMQVEMCNEMENLRCVQSSQNDQLSFANNKNSSSRSKHLLEGSGSSTVALAATNVSALPKRDRIMQTHTAVTMPSMPSASLTSSKALVSTTAPFGTFNGSDATKKGSTSTIWTSEESILRSVGAVDEDNNSSSSACEEASGVLSSGKSGISLDSSGLDNDNNESGIGTATPPKDLCYWKNTQNDNESMSSCDAIPKKNFQNGSSVTSSDDPDLLEVLSLCDESQDIVELQSFDDSDYGDMQKSATIKSARTNKRTKAMKGESVVPKYDNDDNGVNTHHNEDEEGHDEFETLLFGECDCTDGDASSASGSGQCGNRRIGGTSGCQDANSNVILRRKNAHLQLPYGSRAQKCRSHSLDTSSLSCSPHNHMQHLHPHSLLVRKLQHSHNRTKERGQLSLILRQEPFQSLLAPAHFNELPSPSSASLHSGHESLGVQELTTKSNSAPLLMKQERKRDDFAGQKLALRYSRSQSDRYLAEIEAVEACKWLRAAGFPQYAQMYEDHQFPLDLTNVAQDHTNLENDQLQSLYRRLCILNRCANMRLDQSHKTQTPQKEDSDEENFALSENWTFQPHIRRWSRIGEMGLELPSAAQLNEKTESSSKESSPDRFEDDSYDITGTGLSLALQSSGTVDSADSVLNESADSTTVRLRRTGSERIKDGAKAFLRRVESIKSRRRKRQNREGIVISGPQALDLSQLTQRSSLRKPDAVYSTPPSPSAVSPMHTFPKTPLFGNELKVPSNSENFLSPNRSSPKRAPTTPRSMRTSPLHFFTNQMPHLKEGKSDDSSSYYSDSQESSIADNKLLRKTPSKTRRFLQRSGKVDDIGAHSDSECHHGRKLLIKDANANATEVKVKKLTRGGSLNLGKDGKKRDGFRSTSFRSRSTNRKETKSEEIESCKKTPVVRWHSFQMEQRPLMVFRKCFSQKIEPKVECEGVLFAAMSAGQLQIIRKLALVILTGYMERYCPSHRSGWNWELPKFIKKIKMPDYKDKKVFGVPLLLILQRTGQPLPVAVRAALRWLQVNALDQIGLFRKSGVKSRIIKLKELIEYSESTAECMEVFNTQQAYDVADMLKQYFRDLPESLLTTKMSETFATIFQHLPPDVRLDAVQCAVLLLPDENREILYALLEFLTIVASNSQFNQMTANNLAVCLAPSLFHSSISTNAVSVTASPRRRKGAGVPDAKELSEAKASHECLAFMIDNYKQIFTASKEKIAKCNFGYMEESKPVPLEALGEGMQFHNWRGYLYECTSATIKEGREKTRGWITITSQVDCNVEIAYKKVGDGHPLRLWRCITEVEGPPKDVLNYITNHRASWDSNLLQSQTVKKLDERTEIFQYAVDGQFPTDFCVLRSWQSDLPRGACVIVETSIDNTKAKPLFGAVRGVVLASRYLIEPCGSGRSRVMHLARVDIKGKTPEWYNKSYGHICSHHLARIRLAFKHNADGPESKV